MNVAPAGHLTEVTFTVLMEPEGAEGWQTGVALDGSASMQGNYGKELDDGPAGPPSSSLLQQYQRQGWLQIYEHQGQRIPILNLQAKADLVSRRHFNWTPNLIEPLAREVTAYLASNLDADGGTTVIYWACGDGSQIEEVGDLTAEDCRIAPFGGPAKIDFGQGTVLTPAVRYFADRFRDAKNGIYIFVTDGELHDLEDVKRYTVSLCRDIQAKRRNPLKCVLIGIGDNIDEGQMEELDDLDSGTDVDLWDHKIAREMRSLVEIFAEVVSENQIVAPTGRIFDAAGGLVKNFTDGLPGKVTFTMPSTSNAFELEVQGRRIRQPLAAGL